MTNLYDELQWRGMVSAATEGLADVLANERVTAYIGFDPTASSLHVGSLLTVMGLARLQRCGHTPIAIVGGGTGMIGDPSGKSLERTLLSREQIEENVAGIKALARFRLRRRETRRARQQRGLAGRVRSARFLRDTGKYFTVNYMLQKESVNRWPRARRYFTPSSAICCFRRGTSWSCRWMHRTPQMGGSDQWGNIIAGTDLIRKPRQKAHGSSGR
jgi:tyrosyl-tRNA synthetase